MKSIFEQYGTVIIVALVIVALIGCSVVVTPMVKDNYGTMVESFFGQVEDVDTSGSGGSTGGAGGAGGSSEACPSGGTHNLQNGRQWSDEMIEAIAPSLGHTPQEVKELIPTGAFDDVYVCSQCYSIIDLLTNPDGTSTETGIKSAPCRQGGNCDLHTIGTILNNESYINLLANNIGMSNQDIKDGLSQEEESNYMCLKCGAMNLGVIRQEGYPWIEYCDCGECDVRTGLPEFTGPVVRHYQNTETCGYCDCNHKAEQYYIYEFSNGDRYTVYSCLNCHNYILTQ